MKKILCTLLILVLSLIIYGYNIEYHAEYSSFSMSQLKKFQDDILYSFDEPNHIKIMHNYPNNITHKLFIIQRSKKYSYGIFGGFTSTGSRLHQSDFTGDYKFDQIISMYELGFFGEEINKTFFNNRLVPYLQISYIKNVFRINEMLVIEDQKFKSSATFESIGLSGQVGFSFLIINKFLDIKLNLGYRLSHSYGLHLKDNKNALLYSESGHAKPNWDGFRLGLIFSY